MPHLSAGESCVIPSVLSLSLAGVLLCQLHLPYSVNDKPDVPLCPLPLPQATDQQQGQDAHNPPAPHDAREPTYQVTAPSWLLHLGRQMLHVLAVQRTVLKLYLKNMSS